MYKKMQEEIDRYYFKYFLATFILSIAEHAKCGRNVCWTELFSFFSDCIMWCDLIQGPTCWSEKQGTENSDRLRRSQTHGPWNVHVPCLVTIGEGSAGSGKSSSQTGPRWLDTSCREGLVPWSDLIPHVFDLAPDFSQLCPKYFPYWPSMLCYLETRP